MLLKIIRYLERKLTHNELMKECNCKGKVLVKGQINIWNKNVTIGTNCQLYPGVTFWGDGPIIIGNNVRIGFNTIIYASAKAGVFISNNTSIAANCYIIDMNHGLAMNELIQNQPNITEKIYIGCDCWIGANCVVAKGSNMRNGSVLGAGSFLNSEIEENAIFAGSPAKLINKRK